MYARKWAHIWKVDENTVVIKFSDSEEVEKLPSIHFSVHQAVSNDVEERLRRLEVAVEELRFVFNSKLQESNKNAKKIAPPAGFEPATIGLTGRRSTS